MATTAGSLVSTWPRDSIDASAPARFSAVRPGSAVSTDEPWTWISRARTSRSPGTTRRVAPRSSVPPRSVPVTTDPTTLDREDTVDREATGVAATDPRRRAATASLTRRSAARTASIPVPSADDAARTGSRSERRPGEQRADRRDHIVPPGILDGVDLRHDRDPVADPERVEQREVLERLRPRTVVGGDDQQRGIDLAGPDEHVADQLVVPRHIDEVELGPVVEREVRIADVDGHPAALLLGQPVGVDAGQRAQQRGLAVVDVPGRADDDGHARRSRAWVMAAPRAPSASGSTVRRSRTTRSSSIRPMTAGSPRRSAASRRVR